MEKSYTEKLARYIMVIITVAIVAAVCWRIRNVLMYITLAIVVPLMADPLCNLMCRIRVKGRGFPRWLATILSISMIFGVIFGVIRTAIPFISGIAHDISSVNINNMALSVKIPLAQFNCDARRMFPQLGADFRVESLIIGMVQERLNAGVFSTVLGSVTSFFVNLGITIFSVVFISFFFVKNPGMVTAIITALVPEKHEGKVRASLKESGVLVSRYFVGLAIEVLGVALLNFIGLRLIADMGREYSLGIALLTGALNIIPYLGPLFGGIIGILLSLIIKYACFTVVGPDVEFLPFILILAGIFTFTQIVDNYVYQPLIYSNSVKIHPLEVFIVFLIAAEVGGAAGMLAAIPAYTVFRVVIRQFCGQTRTIRKLEDALPKRSDH